MSGRVPMRLPSFFIRTNMAKPKQVVDYQNRAVPKDHFRVFVYNKNGQRLVESYEEFKAAIASKEWFETKAEVHAPPPPVKPKKVKKVKTDGSTGTDKAADSP